MNMRRKRRAVATMAFAALLAGCGSDDGDNGPNAEPRAQRATSATPRLVGGYRRALIEADITRTENVRREAGPNQGRPEPGRLELTLSDGTLKLVDLGADATVLQDFSATSDGAFRIGAYQRPEEGSFCGPDIPQTASYAWKLEGDVLTLKARQDRCADRDSVLTGDWKRR